MDADTSRGIAGRLELPDGEVLTWVVIDEPAPPRLECFRLHSTGAIHHARASPSSPNTATLTPGFGCPDDGITLGRSARRRSASYVAVDALRTGGRPVDAICGARSFSGPDERHPNQC